MFKPIETSNSRFLSCTIDTCSWFVTIPGVSILTFNGGYRDFKDTRGLCNLSSMKLTYVHLCRCLQREVAFGCGC